MTKRYKFIALVNAQEGRDDEFNAWHTEVHLPEVVRAAGFTRGERMRLVAGSNGDGAEYRYLVIFEGEGDHPMAALEKLGAAVAAGEIAMSDSLGAPLWSSLYEEVPDASVTA